MKITFDKKILTEAITRMMLAVTSKSVSLITEGVLIKAEQGEENVTLTTYDMEKGVRLYIPADVHEGGSYIISAQKLLGIFRTMPGEEVDLKVDDKNIVTVTSGKSTFKLHALSGSDFPNLPVLTAERGFSVKQGDLKNLITRVLFAVAVGDQNHTMLNGVYFEIKDNMIKVIGCDGFKFGMCNKLCDIQNKDLENPADFRFILPVKTAGELIKMLPNDEDIVKIEMTRKHIMIKIDDLLLFSRIIDQEYIDYERVIPAESRIKVTVNPVDLVSALERASIVTEERISGSVPSYVKFTLAGNKLDLTSTSVTGSIKDEITVFHEGDDIEIGFKCRYLLDTFRACGDKEVVLRLNSPQMNMIISPLDPDEEDNFLYFVFPLKMREQA